MKTVIRLHEVMFSQQEHLLVEAGEFSTTSFQFVSGVRALRLRNGRGEIILLPFQGQQVWSAEFDGRPLTMKSMFDQPRPTSNYLENYGGLLLHCGFTAMGVPAENDHHPLHGELPNAHYQQAFLELGEDESGAYMGVGGSYQHTVAFSYNYIAEPFVKIHAGETLVDVSIRFTNLKNSEMEYMYLAHINLLPVNGSNLVYSAITSPEHVRVRRTIPSHVHPKPGYTDFLDQLSQNPSRHHLLTPDMVYDPEVVFFIDYLADAHGWAHSLQLHPDGSADYVAHRIDQLPIGVRWICRTADQDALGLVLPATAEPEGFSAEKEKGNVRVLGPKESIQMSFRFGSLTAAEAIAQTDRIQKIVTQR